MRFRSGIVAVCVAMITSVSANAAPLDGIKDFLNRVDRIKLSYSSFAIEVGISPKSEKHKSGIDQRTYYGETFRISWPDANWIATINPGSERKSSLYVPFTGAEIPVELRNNTPSGALLPLNVYVATCPATGRTLQALSQQVIKDQEQRGWRNLESRSDEKNQQLLTFYKPLNEDFGYYQFHRLVVTSGRAYFLNAGIASTTKTGVTLQRDLLLILNSFTASP